MSVLACNRNGCENIMCDSLIQGVYICNECKGEFEKKIILKMKVLEVGVLTKGQFARDFESFLLTDKKYTSDILITLSDFLNQV